MRCSEALSCCHATQTNLFFFSRQKVLSQVTVEQHMVFFSAVLFVTRTLIFQTAEKSRQKRIMQKLENFPQTYRTPLPLLLFTGTNKREIWRRFLTTIAFHSSLL